MGRRVLRRQGDELLDSKVPRSGHMGVAGVWSDHREAGWATALEHRNSPWRDVASMESLGKPLRTVHRKAAHVCPCHARSVLESQARSP